MFDSARESNTLLKINEVGQNLEISPVDTKSIAEMFSNSDMLSSERGETFGSAFRPVPLVT